MFAGTKRVYATLGWRRVGGPPRVGCSSMLPTEKMKLTVPHLPPAKRYWIAHHNLPMSAADEFSRMVPKLFPDSKIAKTVFSWLHIYQIC